jgi:hypothetical protein
MTCTMTEADALNPDAPRTQAKRRRRQQQPGPQLAEGPTPEPDLPCASAAEGGVPRPAKDWELHPVAAAFPPMSEAEYAALKEDVAAHGVRVPAWTYEGQIIDGRSRLRAAIDTGQELPTREWDGNGSLVEFVVSLNVRRRHLSSAQRAATAVELLPRLEEEAAKREEKPSPKTWGGFGGRQARGGGRRAGRPSAWNQPPVRRRPQEGEGEVTGGVPEGAGR